nr:uncharacterized protein LOC4341169 isoform X2 [Oryza sativa Japonica Group]
MDDSTWLQIVGRLEEEPGSQLVVVQSPADEPDSGGSSPPTQGEQPQPEPHPPPIVDWENLQIIESLDEEGRVNIVDDDELYVLLGLRAEDEAAENAQAAATTEQGNGNNGNGAENRNHDENEVEVEPPVEDEVAGERMMVNDANKPSLVKGTVYPNMKVFRLAVRQFAINEEFELWVKATDRKKYVGACKGASDCPWHVNGRRQADERTVMVTKFTNYHTCTSSGRRKTTTPTSAWVASKAIHILRTDSGMGPKELQKRLQEDQKCKINYDTVAKGRSLAMIQLQGSWEENFHMLYRWRAAVMERSPGSVIEIDTIEVDGKVYFNRFFCALSPWITGFLTGCRPYLSVDSTALNGLWKGHLASAIAIDGNNWMYPIAFGFFDAETTDNWTWFMIQLLKAIGKVSPLAICTDACKGLEIAVHRVFPWAGHRECFNHLTQNLIKKYGGSVFQEMYPVARSYRAQVHEECMDTIKKACTDVALWLDTYHKLIWYRSGFNAEIKCDYVTNNLAECFNNWIRDIKALPICELADTCREMIMTLWNRRRRIGNKFTGT